jgi:hypothetical protein
VERRTESENLRHVTANLPAECLSNLRNPSALPAKLHKEPPHRLLRFSLAPSSKKELSSDNKRIVCCVGSHGTNEKPGALIN